MTMTNAPAAKTRRTLRFNSLGDIPAELDRLAAAKEVEHLGNWTSGQIFSHLARTMDCSIDGFQSSMPAILRFLMHHLMKSRVLNKPMTPGFKLPKSAAYMVPEPIPHEEGLAQLRAAIARLQKETRRVPSPFLGAMSNEDWDKLHCRHCELHLSFLVTV